MQSGGATGTNPALNQMLLMNMLNKTEDELYSDIYSESSDFSQAESEQIDSRHQLEAEPEDNVLIDEGDAENDQILSAWAEASESEGETSLREGLCDMTSHSVEQKYPRYSEDSSSMTSSEVDDIVYTFSSESDSLNSDDPLESDNDAACFSGQGEQEESFAGDRNNPTISFAATVRIVTFNMAKTARTERMNKATQQLTILSYEFRRRYSDFHGNRTTINERKREY